tara:strand:- start:259 stop:618 length:360 start_codon:yes stop_codon:yes gene_type:complete
MKKKNEKITFCFDLDNTICTTKGSSYSKSKPRTDVIKLINNLYDRGHIIKINTARYMGRNNDNIKLAKRQGYTKTYNQLIEWGLKFNSLTISKPSADVYIDDKSYGYDNSWKYKFKQYS